MGFFFLKKKIKMKTATGTESAERRGRECRSTTEAVDEEFPLIARARALRAARLEKERIRTQERRENATQRREERTERPQRQCRRGIRALASLFQSALPEALAERRLNGAGAGDQVTSASSDATHARVASAAPATFAPSLVRAEFHDACVRMAKIGREVNDLILRGCYLSQQTMMDAESNQRSAFRIAAEPLIEDAAATEGRSTLKNRRNLQHQPRFTDLPSSGDSDNDQSV